MKSITGFINSAKTFAIRDNSIKGILFFAVMLFTQTILFQSVSHAQNLPLAWVKAMGGSTSSYINEIKVDASGNIYALGDFAGTVDLDPGPGNASLTSMGNYDVFILKLDAAGNFKWAQYFGGTGFDRGVSLTTDANGNVIISGYFSGAVTFGPGTFNLNSDGNSDYFICKLDPDGNLLWVDQVGDVNSNGNINSIAPNIHIGSDMNGNIYATGYFVGTVDLDPGPGTFNLTTSTGAPNFPETFVLKLGPAGDFIWAKQFTGDARSIPSSIYVDNNGNNYIVGEFALGTIDFDPGPASYNLTTISTAENIFICKLDASGNFVWVKQFPGTTTNAVGGTATALTLAANGDIIVTGNFKGTFDFDPGPGIFAMSAVTANETFIVRLTGTGNFIWAKYIATAQQFPSGGYQVVWRSIFTDPPGNIYLCSSFYNTVDFDPGPAVYNLASTGNWDNFLEVFDNAGNFINVRQQGGTGAEGVATGATMTAAGEIVVAGGLGASADFDPCPGVYNVNASGNLSLFVEKFGLPTVTITSSSTPVCLGTSVTFTATPVNAGVSPFYQWQVNGVNVGTNSNTFTSNTLNDNDQVKLVYTSNATCSPSTSATSNTITVSVITTTVVPSVSISTPTTTVCPGTYVSFSAAAVNTGVAPNHQWQVNGINVGTNSATYTTNGLLNGDLVKLIITSNSTCVSPLTATSNTIAMNIYPVVVSTVNITTPNTTICAGSAATFTAIFTPAVVTPAYQWRVNGSNVGTNSPTYTNSTLVNGDIVQALTYSNSGCISPFIATSNPITINVGAMLTPSVNIATGNTTICAGTAATFTATPVNGGTAPSYQWQVNGINVGTNGPTYTTSTLANGDAVTVIMTAGSGCLSVATATSNTITMNIASSVPASVNITSTAVTICSGGSITFTATPVNGGIAPVYQWQVNGVNVGINAPAYTTSTLLNAAVVKVIMTSGMNCASGSPASSNAIIIAVDPLVNPSLNISASATSICTGSNITFTATPVNGGSAPVYQWQVNGINVGTNNSTYTTNSLANGDNVNCILNSNYACLSALTATSNTIQVTVSSSVIPSVSIAASANNICSGTMIAFTATAVNGGSAPSYQWKINGVNVGNNSPAYSTNTFANSDIITCVLTNTDPCNAVTTATSNSITMIVKATVVPSLAVTASANNICFGTPVSFFAVPANTGTVPSYQWQVNGINVGNNSAGYINNSLVNGDKVNCIMNTVTDCSTDPYVYSDTIVMIIKAVPLISFNPVTATISLGSSIQLNATVTGITGSYLWTPSTGLNDPASLNPVANPVVNTVYKLSVVGTNNCSSEKTIHVTVYRDIYIPNSFTPDGNGINDVFRIPPATPMQLKSFQIYNRLGNLVFNTSDINTGWDGTYKGIQSPAGAYTYMISGSGPKGGIFIQGSVIIIR